jgi:hypothetical protein
MRRPVLITAIVAAAIFGAGLLIGQLGGIPTGSAASPAATAVPSVPHWMGRLGGHDRPDAAGKVTAVNGDTVTITPGGFRNDNSTVKTIQLTSSTTYNQGFGPSAAAASKSSIKTGTFVIAHGTLSSDGTSLTATEMTVLPSAPTPGAFGHGFGHLDGPHADGTVTAINGNTISIKPDGDRPGSQESSITSIVVSSSTTYDAGPGVAAGKDSIKVGGFVRAEGTVSSDGKTLTASRVSVMAAGQPGTHTSPFGDVSGAST